MSLDWWQLGWLLAGFFFVLFLAVSYRLTHQKHVPSLHRSERNVFKIPGEKIIEEWEE